MKKKRRVALSLVVGLSVLLLGAVQVLIGTGVVGDALERSFPTRTPLEARLDAAQILPEDLPFGWQKGGSQIEDAPGTIANRFLWYYGPEGREKTWVNVSQQLMVYPDADSAKEAYREELLGFNEDWILPPDLRFEGEADELYIACLPAFINGLPHNGCEVVGLYGDTLSILRGKVFETQWLTAEDFITVLTAMDQRVSASVDE